MNKEITIYELLGLIKNNKAPKIIKCNDLIFIYNEPSKDYVYERSNSCWLFKHYIELGKEISKKVEILEEDEDIEELKIANDKYPYYDNIEIGDKLNEVIREVNKLRKEINNHDFIRL